MAKRKESVARGPQLHVRVLPMSFEGRPLFKDELTKRPSFEGDLRVREDRLHKHGRVVTVATLLGRQDGTEVIVMQLNDVVLLWISDRKIRLRGFEYVGDTEYAQVWDIEVL